MRLVQIIVVGLLLIILSPLMIIIYLILFFQGRKPIFIQSRLGKDLNEFQIYKFKTMDDDNGASNFVDRLLRIFGLDEIPQLINILKGDMNFIGPRPLLPDAKEVLSRSEFVERSHVKPGITGWAQINGRNEMDWPERFKLDIYYVQHQTWLFDAKILFITFLKIITAPWNSLSSHHEVRNPKDL